MGELASREQLRMSFLRWAIVTVPLVIFLGFLMGRISNSGFGNPWFDALKRPDIFPPGWAFGAAWSLLYAMLGVAIAIILDARRALGRGRAIGLFVVQLIINYSWSPIFFAAHQITFALVVILANLALAIATTFAFGGIRKAAAWLMVPYLAWLCFAAILNYQMDRLNPDAETLAPVTGKTTIAL